jgi:hypothetical protein
MLFAGESESSLPHSKYFLDGLQPNPPMLYSTRMGSDLKNSILGTEKNEFWIKECEKDTILPAIHQILMWFKSRKGKTF